VKLVSCRTSSNLSLAKASYNALVISSATHQAERPSPGLFPRRLQARTAGLYDVFQLRTVRSFCNTSGDQWFRSSRFLLQVYWMRVPSVRNLQILFDCRRESPRHHSESHATSDHLIRRSVALWQRLQRQNMRPYSTCRRPRKTPLPSPLPDLLQYLHILLHFGAPALRTKYPVRLHRPADAPYPAAGKILWHDTYRYTLSTASHVTPTSAVMPQHHRRQRCRGATFPTPARPPVIRPCLCSALERRISRTHRRRL